MGFRSHFITSEMRDLPPEYFDALHNRFGVLQNRGGCLHSNTEGKAYGGGWVYETLLAIAKMYGKPFTVTLIHQNGAVTAARYDGTKWQSVGIDWPEVDTGSPDHQEPIFYPQQEEIDFLCGVY